MSATNCEYFENVCQRNAYKCKKKKKKNRTIMKSSILAIRLTDVSTLRSIKLVNFMPPARDNDSRYRGEKKIINKKKKKKVRSPGSNIDLSCR